VAIGAPNSLIAGYYCVFAVVKAMASRVFCPTSCAFPEPDAGLGLTERFPERTARGPANHRRRGLRKNSAAILGTP